jgi:hypothetical protein
MVPGELGGLTLLPRLTTACLGSPRPPGPAQGDHGPSTEPSPALADQHHYQDWDRGPFTGESQDHISVCEVTAAPAG